MKYLHLLAGALALVTTITLTAPQTAQACTIDGKPTAFADGSRAVVSHVKLTVATARTWALFSFRNPYHAHAAIRLTEDRAQLRGCCSLMMPCSGPGAGSLGTERTLPDGL